MIRVIGFFFGVAIAISLLAAVVDAPTRERAAALATDLSSTVFDAVDRRVTEPEIHMPREIAAPAPTPSTAVRLVESRSVEETQFRTDANEQSDETLIDAPTEPAQTIASTADSAAVPVTKPEPQTVSDAIKTTATTAASSRVPEVQVWQPVWQAFRSELSAKGFAGQLRRLTGQEYRVRRASPWTYQVELAYADEGQRDAVLREIQAKTGLGLMETQP